MRSIPVILALIAAAAAGVSSNAPAPRAPPAREPGAERAVPPLPDAPGPSAPATVVAPAREPVGAVVEPAAARRSEAPAAAVEGIVVDEDGVPIEDFEMVAPPSRHYGAGECVNRGRGEFAYRRVGPVRLSPGRFGFELFTIRAPGRVPHEMRPTPEQIAALGRGESLRDLKITLRRAAVISGTVVLPDGTPARNAVVRLASAADLLETSWGHFAPVDAEGRFEIDEVDPAAELHLRAGAGDGLVSDTLALADVLDGADRADVFLALRPRSRVTVEIATAGIERGWALRLDGFEYPRAEPVTRIDTRTGPHVLRVMAKARSLAEVRFEIPEGLAVHRLDLKAPEGEETARAGRLR